MSLDSALVMYEVGSIAALGGIHPHPIPVQPDGTFDLADIRGALRDPHNVHYPISTLIALENAQCGVGGIPVSAAYTAEVAALAAAHGLKVHVDGSRMFNAAVALDCTVQDLSDPVDSVSFCLSKGLSAPVGAVVVGDDAFIQRARRTRKALGGGMRQAGVLAAAGLVAFQEVLPRLHDDHATARQLAEGLAAVPGIELDPANVHINLVFFRLAEDAKLSAFEVDARLREYGIWTGARDERRFRLVTHYWITPQHIERVVDAFREVLA
jgi:threonine aldolase